MKAIPYTLSTILSLLASIGGSAHGVQALVDEKLTGRVLAGQCPFASKALAYFDLTVEIVPSASNTCTNHEKNKYRKRIDAALRELDASQTDVSVVAKVCKPAEIGSTSRYLRSFLRKLPGGGGGWSYNGGGGCSYCNGDDGDRRGLAVPPPSASVSGGAEQEFDYNIKPSMESQLRSILMSDIATELPCAGGSSNVLVSLMREDVTNVGQALFCTEIDVVDVSNELQLLDQSKQEMLGGGSGANVP